MCIVKQTDEELKELSPFFASGKCGSLLFFFNSSPVSHNIQSGIAYVLWIGSEPCNYIMSIKNKNWASSKQKVEECSIVTTSKSSKIAMDACNGIHPSAFVTGEDVDLRFNYRGDISKKYLS